MSRFLLPAALALVSLGCSPDGGLADPAAAHVVTAGGDVDLHFKPLDLRPGETVEAAIGSVRLTSTLRDDGAHHVALNAQGRTVHRVSGTIDGSRVIATRPGPIAGETSVGPTSVHRSWDCEEGTGSCREVIEYDYDLHRPDGEGTAQWRTPDGRSATIDRLRYELDAEPTADAAPVRLLTPQPATIVTAEARVR